MNARKKKRTVRRKSAASNSKTRRTRPPGRAKANAPRAETPPTIAALVTAAAQTLALPIESSSRPAIEFNLQLLYSHAARIDEFVLPDEIEPAPVFRA